MRGASPSTAFILLSVTFVTSQSDRQNTRAQPRQIYFQSILTQTYLALLFALPESKSLLLLIILLLSLLLLCFFFSKERVGGVGDIVIEKKAQTGQCCSCKQPTAVSFPPLLMIIFEPVSFPGRRTKRTGDGAAVWAPSSDSGTVWLLPYQPGVHELQQGRSGSLMSTFS